MSQISFTERTFFLFTILTSIYAAGVILAGLHGAKLAQLGPFTFDSGLITFSLSFFITDIVSETFGKRYSRRIVLGTVAALLVGFLLTKLSLLLPSSLDWEIAEQYSTTMETGLRVFVAAIITFVLSQLTDITVFAWIKKKTGPKHLWLRNNVSTLAGGLVDAIMFSTIAFYGVYPLLPIILSAYAIRILVSILDTPFVYLGVWLIRRAYPELKK